MTFNLNETLKLLSRQNNIGTDVANLILDYKYQLEHADRTKKINEVMKDGLMNVIITIENRRIAFTVSYIIPRSILLRKIQKSIPDLDVRTARIGIGINIDIRDGETFVFLAEPSLSIIQTNDIKRFIYSADLAQKFCIHQHVIKIFEEFGFKGRTIQTFIKMQNGEGTDNWLE